MTKALGNQINCSEMLNAIQERKRWHGGYSGINWGSFRGRREGKWGSFQGRHHFGVGIISGAVQEPSSFLFCAQPGCT